MFPYFFLYTFGDTIFKYQGLYIDLATSHGIIQIKVNITIIIIRLLDRKYCMQEKLYEFTYKIQEFMIQT